MITTKTQRFSKPSYFLATFIAILIVALPAWAKKNEVATPSSIAERLNSLDKKERLFVIVNTEVNSNITLAAASAERAKVLGSLDEEEALNLTLAKTNFMSQLAEKSVPGQLTTYYADWKKAIQGYLDGKITLIDLVNKRKTLHPKLASILEAQLKQEQANKYKQKHGKLIQELSVSFYKPARLEVLKKRNEDVKNNAKFADTKCLSIKDKWKKCGLTGDVKPLIGKIKPDLVEGSAKIYKTMRIGDKFVFYVIFGQTKKEMSDAAKDALKTNPKAIQVASSVSALTSLCQDSNVKKVLAKTKSRGQIVMYTRDLLPIYNLLFKDCGDLAKMTSKKKPAPTSKK